MDEVDLRRISHPKLRGATTMVTPLSLALRFALPSRATPSLAGI
jgi:hypothetical protein